jgi:hypothetical protein
MNTVRRKDVDVLDLREGEMEVLDPREGEGRA